jgi:hypothetical protein
MVRTSLKDRAVCEHYAKVGNYLDREADAGRIGGRNNLTTRGLPDEKWLSRDT